MSASTQASVSNMTNILNYDNEIGTPTKPPRLMNLEVYSNWKSRFKNYVNINDTSVWIPIAEGYTHPTYTQMGISDTAKLVSTLTVEEKTVYDREKKALAALSMCLPLDIYHTFKKYKTSRDLWEVDELMSRYYHLLSEMVNNDITYKNEKVLEKFLAALPAHFEMYSIVIKEHPEFDKMGLEDLMGMIQSYDLNKKKKNTVYQDPNIYFGKIVSPPKSGIALFSREISNNQGSKESSCGESAYCFVASSSSWQDNRS
ncbi:hypothetical protein L1987_06691 [Smallanthus sonchifolius]|uniref:Uncharacterized protein n=1 Tax=Smallanthus sonchifolius TaxID=185202 RepID=A0ACB9JZ24_9ASTR|nr:hypothetical protein L1987_06691 [Smallanthus sonchifolius]